MNKIAYYISAHGYGHGARSCDILRALRQRYPDIRVTVVSDLPETFLKSRLPHDGVTFRRAAFDVGMVQVDSIRVDVPATLEKIQAVYARRKDMIASEAAWLERNGIRVVVCDIPALPLEAAARIGIPRLAVGNFAWDWIYEEFIARDVAWAPVVDAIREGYGQTNLLLRLPFAEPMAAFPRRRDIPLVATPGTARRADVARATGASLEKTWALLSFTTLDWNAEALARVERLRDVEFFTVQPLAWQRPNIHAVDRNAISFADVIASVDVVITKPGFGILSECVVNRKPIVYADRTDFREYPILEAAVKKYLRHAHIPAAALYRGELSTSLQALATAPEPPLTLEAGGAAVAAKEIAAAVA